MWVQLCAPQSAHSEHLLCAGMEQHPPPLPTLSQFTPHDHPGKMKTDVCELWVHIAIHVFLGLLWGLRGRGRYIQQAYMEHQLHTAWPPTSALRTGHGRSAGTQDKTGGMASCSRKRQAGFHPVWKPHVVGNDWQVGAE